MLENSKLLNCLPACVRTSSCSSPLCTLLINCCLLCSTGTSVPNCFQCCTSSSDPVQSCPADPDICWLLSFCSNYFYVSILPVASSGTVQNGTLLTSSEKHKLLLSTNSAVVDLGSWAFETRQGSWIPTLGWLSLGRVLKSVLRSQLFSGCPLDSVCWPGIPVWD